MGTVTVLILDRWHLWPARASFVYIGTIILGNQCSDKQRALVFVIFQVSSWKDKQRCNEKTQAHIVYMRHFICLATWEFWLHCNHIVDNVPLWFVEMWSETFKGRFNLHRAVLWTISYFKVADYSTVLLLTAVQFLRILVVDLLRCRVGWMYEFVVSPCSVYGFNAKAGYIFWMEMLY